MYKSKNQPGSRSQILHWINKTLNINQTRIQNLATGVVYCMIVNYYHPNTIPQHKIINFPKNHHDYRVNLKKLQEGFAALDIKNIVFDVFKVSEMTYTDNWNLICKIYRHFNASEKDKNVLLQSKWSKASQNKIQTNFNKNNSLNINPLSTPMKPPKMPEDGKIRWQTMNMIEEIKRIVTVQGVTDRVKVGQLRHMLGLQDEQGAESQTQLKDLLSDYKKKQEVINLD